MNDDFYNKIHRSLYNLIMDYELSKRLFNENCDLINNASKLLSMGYIELEQFEKVESDYMPLQDEVRKSTRKIGNVLKSYFAERRKRTAKVVHQFNRRSVEITAEDLSAARIAHDFIRSHISEFDDDSAYDVELPFAIKDEIREALDENWR